MANSKKCNNSKQIEDKDNVAAEKSLKLGSVFFSVKTDPVPSVCDFNRHMHEEYEVLYVVSGSGTQTIEERSYRVQSGSLFLIKPRQYHYVDIDDTQPYRRIYISFSQGCLPELLVKTAYNTFEHILPGEDSPIALLLKRMTDYFDIFSREEFSHILFCLLTELMCLVPRHYSGGQDNLIDELPFKDQTVKRAVEYIRDNLTSIHTIDDIASALYISRSTLYHTFNKKMKIGIMRYVRGKKLLYAKSLLSSGVPPTLVCIKSGFKDYATFYRAYSNYFSVSPSKISTTKKTDI